MPSHKRRVQMVYYISSMITYEPKNWFTFIFRLHKADTVRTLIPMLIAISLYSGLIAVLELEIWNISKNPYVKNLTLLHNLLGFVLSLLLVFRTNTAYDRWWEGRKLWGALVNNSRSLAMKLNAYLPETDKESRQQFKRLIVAYADSLKNHLRNERTRVELDAEDHPELNDTDSTRHMPNFIAALLIKKISRLQKEGKLQAEHLISLTPEMNAFTEVCGACERIKNTPIPFSYSMFVKKFIFFYVMTLPFGFVFNLGYFVIPVVAFVFYVLASLELIGEEIEDPFDGDANDIPTEKIAEGINKHIEEILQ
jgi:ion channel-forming bestrophin family protein